MIRKHYDSHYQCFLNFTQHTTKLAFPNCSTSVQDVQNVRYDYFDDNVYFSNLLERYKASEILAGKRSAI